MSLNFPNPSRSYDVSRTGVRFWGHEGALEVSFFLEREALQRISPGTTQSEDALLSAFDRNRSQILVVARKVYARRRLGSYTLTASDF